MRENLYNEKIKEGMMDKMKNEKGMTYLTLLIILVILAVVIVAIVFFIKGEYQQETIENRKTDLLLVQGKVTMLEEMVVAKREGAAYIGKKVVDNKENEQIKTLLEKGIIAENEENFDSYYLLEKEDLDALGLSQLELKEGEVYVVNYKTGEVMMTVPVTIENTEYYTLSSIRERDEKLNAEAGTSTENVADENVAETTENEESTENNAEEQAPQNNEEE